MLFLQVTLIGHINAEMTSNYLEEFCAFYNLNNFTKEGSCSQTTQKVSILQVFMRQVFLTFIN